MPGYMLSSVGIEHITTAPEKIPKIKQGASDFSYTPGNSITRPLVLVSAPHFNGPEGWKPTSDLTGSGHSVWILQTSRGEDGYELFYDDFARHASFSWQYH